MTPGTGSAKVMDISVLSVHGLHSERVLSTIKDWDQLHQGHFCVVFTRLLCSAAITNENEFHNSSSPTLCAFNDITSGHAHSLYLEIWLL